MKRDSYQLSGEGEAATEKVPLLAAPRCSKQTFLFNSHHPLKEVIGTSSYGEETEAGGHQITRPQFLATSWGMRVQRRVHFTSPECIQRPQPSLRTI